MTYYLLTTLVLFSLFSSLTSGATLTSVSVEKNDNRYILHAEAKLNADSSRIKQIVTDYNNLTSIDPYLKESKLISTSEDDRKTVSTLTEACMLFICYKIRHVQVFQLLENDILYGRTIPESSDFKKGWTRWAIEQGNLNQKKSITYLTIDTEMTPDFFVLPIIGTYHLKNKIIEMITVTINNLEKKAQNKQPILYLTMSLHVPSLHWQCLVGYTLLPT